MAANNPIFLELPEGLFNYVVSHIATVLEDDEKIGQRVVVESG
jgi:hypothetical protein